VRLLTNDEPQQAWRVADLIDASSACFVPITVVLVLVLVLEWMLRGAYQLSRETIGRGLDFAGALHLLRSEGCAALVSFDRAFVRTAGELSLTHAVQEL
jgi:predicted nucleic-acid-binding protein